MEQNFYNSNLHFSNHFSNELYQSISNNLCETDQIIQKLIKCKFSNQNLLKAHDCFKNIVKSECFDCAKLIYDYFKNINDFLNTIVDISVFCGKHMTSLKRLYEFIKSDLNMVKNIVKTNQNIKVNPKSQLYSEHYENIKNETLKRLTSIQILGETILKSKYKNCDKEFISFYDSIFKYIKWNEEVSSSNPEVTTF